MGLLSKFIKKVVEGTAEELGNKEAGKAADYLSGKISDAIHGHEEELKEAADALQAAAQNMGEATQELAQHSQELAQTAQELGEEVTIPGNSWGPTMPLEENQYNYPGNYEAYFEHIFREDFGGFRLEKQQWENSNGIVYTLWDGEKQAAVVELLNKNSVRHKVQRDCLQNGIPYARFYYDAEGWWNTRAYVKDRITKAMAGQI